MEQSATRDSGCSSLLTFRIRRETKSHLLRHSSVILMTYRCPFRPSADVCVEQFRTPKIKYGGRTDCVWLRLTSCQSLSPRNGLQGFTLNATRSVITLIKTLSFRYKLCKVHPQLYDGSTIILTFLSCVSILTSDIDIANLSVRLSVTFRYQMKTADISS